MSKTTYYALINQGIQNNSNRGLLAEAEKGLLEYIKTAIEESNHNEDQIYLLLIAINNLLAARYQETNNFIEKVHGELNKEQGNRASKCESLKVKVIEAAQKADIEKDISEKLAERCNTMLDTVNKASETNLNGNIIFMLNGNTPRTVDDYNKQFNLFTKYNIRIENEFIISDSWKSQDLSTSKLNELITQDMKMKQVKVKQKAEPEEEKEERDKINDAKLFLIPFFKDDKIKAKFTEDERTKLWKYAKKPLSESNTFFQDFFSTDGTLTKYALDQLSKACNIATGKPHYLSNWSKEQLSHIKQLMQTQDSQKLGDYGQYYHKFLDKINDFNPSKDPAEVYFYIEGEKKYTAYQAQINNLLSDLEQKDKGNSTDSALGSGDKADKLFDEAEIIKQILIKTGMLKDGRYEHKNYESFTKYCVSRQGAWSNDKVEAYEALNNIVNCILNYTRHGSIDKTIEANCKTVSMKGIINSFNLLMNKIAEDFINSLNPKPEGAVGGQEVDNVADTKKQFEDLKKKMQDKLVIIKSLTTNNDNNTLVTKYKTKIKKLCEEVKELNNTATKQVDSISKKLNNNDLSDEEFKELIANYAVAQYDFDTINSFYTNLQSCSYQNIAEIDVNYLSSLLGISHN